MYSFKIYFIIIKNLIKTYAFILITHIAYIYSMKEKTLVSYLSNFFQFFYLYYYLYQKIVTIKETKIF